MGFQEGQLVTRNLRMAKLAREADPEILLSALGGTIFNIIEAYSADDVSSKEGTRTNKCE